LKGVLACDPGKSGGFALLTESGQLEVFKTPQTLKDMVSFSRGASLWCRTQVTPVIEKVGSMPSDGKKALFTFGGWTYAQTMALIALTDREPLVVTPREWQEHFGLYGAKYRGTKSAQKTAKKNVHKAVAEKLYPGHKFTHYTADAALIAHYARTLA